MPHLDLDLLLRALAGDVTPHALVRRLLAHVAESCPECREALEELRLSPAGPPATARDAAAVAVAAESEAGDATARLPDPRFVGARDPVAGWAAEWARKVRREQRRAAAELRELLRTPPGERLGKVESARTRFRSRALAELLVEESRQAVRRDPEEAASLASLVDVVLLWTPGAVGQEWSRLLSLRSQAASANALRVAGDLRESDRAFERLRARLGAEPCDDTALHLELASLEASLRIDQGRLEEARRLVQEALALAREAGDHEAVPRALMQRAVVERREGRFAAAAATQEQVLTLLDAERDAPLYLSGVVNLGLYLLELERHREAAELLAAHRERLQAAAMWRWPNVLILRGRAALVAGRPGEAEELFLAARDDLAERGDAVRAAVASLDLALLYLARGRTVELRRMARAMETVFASEDLHEEAMAAMLLFRQAVAAETLTVESLRSWRRRLEVAGGRRGRRRPS